MDKHKMNVQQITDAVYDWEKDAIRTIPHDDVTHTLSLSATEDSITSISPFTSVKQGIVQDSRQFKRATIYSVGPFTLLAYPEVGATAITISQGPSAIGLVVEVGAAQLQLNGSDEAIMVLQG